MFVRSTAPISSSTGETRQSQGLASTPEHKGERKAARTDRAFTLKVSRVVMEMFGVLVPVGAREYPLLRFSVTFLFERIETRVNSSLMNFTEYGFYLFFIFLSRIN